MAESTPTPGSSVQGYQDARPEFRTGDLLCFRGHSLISRLIRRITRSAYSHAGLVFLYEGRVYCLESVGHGVRLALMSHLVRHYEGGIDYFRIDYPEAVRTQAVGFAFQQLGKFYDQMGLVRFLRALVLKTFPKLPDDDRFFCSELVAWAYLKAESPLVEMAPSYTDPERLAHSPHATFLFEVVLDQLQ